jgi:hypothetical protein
VLETASYPSAGLINFVQAERPSYLVTRLKWKAALPIAQLILALGCHVYDPHMYRIGAYKDRAVNNLEYFGQHSPALAGRLSRGINFPALVLDYPFRNADNPVLYERNTEFTLIWVSPGDVGFFASIVFFWYLAGRKLDDGQGWSHGKARPRQLRITGLACGVVFGVLTGAYADQMIKSHWFPQRYVGTFGIAWALVLIAYFAWRLVGEFRTIR